VLVGKADFLREQGMPTSTRSKRWPPPHQAEGKSAIFVAIDGQAGGSPDVADPGEGHDAEALAQLRALGVRWSCSPATTAHGRSRRPQAGHPTFRPASRRTTSTRR
jgi:hypothetical protein